MYTIQLGCQILQCWLFFSANVFVNTVDSLFLHIIFTDTNYVGLAIAVPSHQLFTGMSGFYQSGPHTSIKNIQMLHHI